jgi:GNAT superfamily N-acetyltransferase
MLAPPLLPVRPPTTADRHALAELMLDAYVGTIDYEGETIVEARAEVDLWYASPERLLERSLVAVEADAIVSAVLLSRIEETPFVAYLYTDPAWKGRGLGESLMRSAMGLARGRRRRPDPPLGHCRQHAGRADLRTPWVRRAAGGRPHTRVSRTRAGAGRRR